MKQLETRSLLKGLGKKYDVDAEEVEFMLGCVFLFVKETIKEESDKYAGKYPSIRIPNFGRFYVPKNVGKHVKEKLNKKKES